MSWLTKTFTSSLGKKLIMALTGLFLCSFLVVHMAGNLQLFKNDQGYAFNTYAVFMTTNPLIKTVSYALYTLILVHAFYGLYLAFKNRKARPVQYATINTNSTWASRNMAILGTLLLVYIVVHMADFWAEYKFGHVPYKMYVEDIRTGKPAQGYPKDMPADFVMEKKMEETLDLQQGVKVTIVKDLYEEVEEAFKNPLLVLLYVIGMFAVAFHLYHGFQSAFQTLGLNHPKYSPAIKFLGIWIFAIGIPLAFAAMPIYFYVKGL
ncbi:MAG: succinate dehydrogenase cytochrome b subunit [Spirosomataceae bacterium]